MPRAAHRRAEWQSRAGARAPTVAPGAGYTRPAGEAADTSKRGHAQAVCPGPAPLRGGRSQPPVPPRAPRRDRLAATQQALPAARRNRKTSWRAARASESIGSSANREARRRDGRCNASFVVPPRPWSIAWQPDTAASGRSGGSPNRVLINLSEPEAGTRPAWQEREGPRATLDRRA